MSKKNVNAILAGVLLGGLSVSCGNHDRKAPPSYDLADWPTGEVVQVGVCDVTLPAGLDPERRARIVDAVATITSAWESDEGWLPATSIAVTDIEPGCNHMGGNYGGCWRGDRFVIVTSSADTCANLYHELAHRTYHLYGHADPRWTHWNARMNELYDQLIARPK